MSLCVGDLEQSAFDHAEDHGSLFGRALSEIGPLDCGGGAEYVSRHVEGDAATAPVGFGFGVQPFEVGSVRGMTVTIRWGQSSCRGVSGFRWGCPVGRGVALSRRWWAEAHPTGSCLKMVG